MNRLNKVHQLCESLYQILFKKDALSLYQLFHLFPNFYILEVVEFSFFKPDCNLFLMITFNLRS